MYQNIEAAGTAGIWVRDIRFNTNLPHPRVTKVLKSLETRKFIKTVKMHSQASKKIYILYELTPSEELTGGRWYGPHTSTRSEPHGILAFGLSTPESAIALTRLNLTNSGSQTATWMRVWSIRCERCA